MNLNVQFDFCDFTGHINKDEIFEVTIFCGISAYTKKCTFGLKQFSFRNDRIENCFKISKYEDIYDHWLDMYQAGEEGKLQLIKIFEEKKNEFYKEYIKHYGL